MSAPSKRGVGSAPKTFFKKKNSSACSPPFMRGLWFGDSCFFAAGEGGQNLHRSSSVENVPYSGFRPEMSARAGQMLLGPA